MGRGWGVRGADSNGTLLTKNCTTFETMVLNFSSLFQKGDFFFLMWLLMSFVFSVLYLKVLKQYTRVLMVLLIV